MMNDVVAAVRRHAESNPAAVAVIDSARSLTYHQLEQGSDAVASWLRERDVGAETVVGVLPGRRGEAIIALLGVLKAGGAYLPLDPHAPLERVGTVAAEASAALVLSGSRGNWPRLADALTARPSVVDFPEPHPASAAYVITTSGSTGRPKTVCVERSALAAHLAAVVREFGLTADDRVLYFAAPHVDVALEQVLAPLSVGATVVAVDERAPAPAALLDLMAAERVTVANLPAGYWSELALGLDRLDMSSTGVLRLMISGSDRMPAHAAREWLKGTAAKVRLMNAYGPTEAVITATVHSVRSADDATIPIGHAVGARRLHVLDPDLRPVPAGEEGELFIGGILARGYAGAPGLTAAAFLPDPYGPPGARMYRTGDIVRQVDGVLEFVGRTDEQMKIRGYRVEPGEVRAMLGSHPGVRDCVVLVEDSPTGGPRLAAYVVARPETVADVREWAAERLPDYLVPAVWTVVERIPLTPAKKVNVRALAVSVPSVEAAPRGAAAQRGDTAPRTGTERLLADAWSRMLGVSDVRTTDNFFELGGDSLTAVRLVTHLLPELGSGVSPYQVFTSPTLGELAADIDRARADGPRRSGPSPTGPLRQAGAGPVPLSYGQEGLWFMDRLHPGTPTYHVPWRFRLRGPLDVPLLERCLSGIMERHGILRTVFPAALGEPGQVVRDPTPVRLDVRNVDGALDDNVHALAIEPFDLANGPPVRFHLLRSAVDDVELVAVFHHIVWDEWSLALFEAELRERYEAGLAGRAPNLPELPVAYTDYATWQREQLRPESLTERLAHWRRVLDGAPHVQELPTDKPRPASRTFAGAVHRFVVPSAVADRLRRLARQEAATPFMVLLAAFTAVLHRMSDATDIVVGSPVADRPTPELERLIGYFVNVVPLRMRVTGDLGFGELLARVRAVCRDAFRHQDLPFELLVKYLNVARSVDRPPLVQVMFEMHSEPAEAARMGNLTVTRQIHPTGTAKFDLTLTVYDHGAALAGLVEYSTDLFARDTVEVLVADLIAVLTTVVTAPGTAVADLPVRGRADPSAGVPAGIPTTRQAPVTRAEALERGLAAVWETVLDIDGVAPDDDFFELGGHSLTAVRIVSRISAAIERDLSPALLFRAPTVARMATALLDGELVGPADDDVAAVAQRLLDLAEVG